MHVGEFVAATVDSEGADVKHVGALHDDASGRAAEVDGIDHDQHVDTVHELLHQVDAADADLHDPHALGQRRCQECLRDGRPDAVVGAQHVAEAGHHCDHGGRVGAMPSAETEDLVARLARYPVERYPVQHATTQFHLGSERLHAGDAATALVALSAASDVFGRAGLRLEQAKADVMLGIGLRAAQRREEAAAAFLRAESVLAELDQPTERAAAAYNLGLVCQDGADLAGACAAWQRAAELFLATGYPAQAAAALRDQGGALVAGGQAAEALPLLAQAMELADRGGDEAGVGAAANVLGLAHLAGDDPIAAVAALRRGLGCFPRSVRPADHAMLKANLALAYEQAADQPRARLAAGQVLAVAAAAPPVRAQAQELLARLGAADQGDLWAVLDDEPADQWAAVLREEILRALELPPAAGALLVRGCLDGLLTRSGTSHDYAESLLHVVLEVPPRPYAQLVAAVVAGVARRPAEDADRLRAVLGSAMARFAMPQWQRLAASLNDAAVAAGQPATWR